MLKFKKARRKFKSQLPSSLTDPFHKKLNEINFHLERKKLIKE
jgi:hypothetical protein